MDSKISEKFNRIYGYKYGNDQVCRLTAEIAEVIRKGHKLVTKLTNKLNDL